MNSADVPSVMQLSVLGLTEQRGSAFTDQQGDPFAFVQLRTADEVVSTIYEQPYQPFRLTLPTASQ